MSLAAIGRLVGRRPGRILLAGLLVLAVSGPLGGQVASKLKPFGFDDPASESVAARNALARAAGIDADNTLVALARLADRSEAPAVVARIRAALEGQPDVARVTWPQDYSHDGRKTYVVAFFRPLDDGARAKAVQEVKRALAGQRSVELGGPAVSGEEIGAIVRDDLRRAELIVFPLLFVLSFWIFRGLVAALLPPLIGGISITVTFFLLRAVNEVVDLSIYALNIVTALGLGLSIDWSLLMLSRYREELATRAPREAILRTVTTAGRTVLFSAVTVAGSMASLLIFPQRFQYSLGVGGVLVCIAGATTAVLFLPALLALLGRRVDALALRRWTRADARPETSGRWYRFSQFVMARPWLTALVSASVLVLLAIPFFGVKLVATGADVLPRSAGARQVSDTLHREFEANRSESPYLVVHATGSGVRERLVEYGDELRGLPAVASVSAPRLVGPETWQIDVGSREKATSDGSLDLVRDIRASAPPYPMEVGGQAASIVDQKASLESYLPWAVPVVVFVTVVALFLMTGSIVLPFKALVMNTLTLGAAFGVLVLIFQDGRLEGLLGYSARGGLNLTNPPLVFAIVFALSTDYGVFLLSRIKEARDGGAGDAEAVALGLVRTGRIVTAAAVLFCVAVLAFATSRIVFIKEFGVGTAAAVLIDATIVRALLVPSLMRLLGRHNWWSPRPLARLHQRLGVDESG